MGRREVSPGLTQRVRGEVNALPRQCHIQKYEAEKEPGQPQEIILKRKEQFPYPGGKVLPAEKMRACSPPLLPLHSQLKNHETQKRNSVKYKVSEKGPASPPQKSAQIPASPFTGRHPHHQVGPLVHRILPQQEESGHACHLLSFAGKCITGDSRSSSKTVPPFHPQPIRLSYMLTSRVKIHKECVYPADNAYFTECCLR